MFKVICVDLFYKAVNKNIKQSYLNVLCKNNEYYITSSTTVVFQNLNTKRLIRSIKKIYTNFTRPVKHAQYCS